MNLDLHAGYSGLVLLGLGLTLAFPVTHGLGELDKRIYVRLQVLTLIAALIGAKIAVIIGDGLWPLQPWPSWRDFIYSGRSIVGALLVGFVTAEIAKPFLRYSQPPNDRFAMMLPFSIGIGRIGCWTIGCCPGVRWDSPYARLDAAGIARFPAQLAEITFQVTMGVMLVFLWRSGRFRGRLFALYLVAYGSFRFISEYWRETNKAFAGFSAYQWMAIALVVCGIWSLHHYRQNARTVLVTTAN
jgi:phosphatidylglycerol---prolipoprotein diacylglyceryl transferase